jgi:hypothetical protein
MARHTISAARRGRYPAVIVTDPSRLAGLYDPITWRSSAVVILSAIDSDRWSRA